MLNAGQVSKSMLNSRLHLLSKNGTPRATLDEIRPLMIESHFLKLAEKVILNKLEKSQSNLLKTGDY